MENKKIDLRRISPEKIKKIKMKAMGLRDEGVSNKEVAQRLNLDPTVLSRWYRKYVKNYRQPLETLKRGRKQGTHKKFTDYQEDIILKRLKKYSGLADKEFVQTIIEKHYKMKIPMTTVGDYLKKWGINSSLIKAFENEFIEREGTDDFQLIKHEIKKRKGMIFWVNIMDYKLENGTSSYSISTRAAKNKLIFKFYEKPIQKAELVEFVNQLSKLFTKHLYVFFSTKNIDSMECNYSIDNSENITFINDR
jgi:transposase